MTEVTPPPYARGFRDAVNGLRSQEPNSCNYLLGYSAGLSAMATA